VPGCVAVFRRIPFPATAIAVVDSCILTCPAALIGEWMEQHPSILANALEVIGTRTEEMLHRLQEFATEPVERRIARALLRLSRQAGRSVASGMEIGFPLSRQDIAEMAGATFYIVSRRLRKWERQNLIVSGRQ